MNILTENYKSVNLSLQMTPFRPVSCQFGAIRRWTGFFFARVLEVIP